MSPVDVIFKYGCLCVGGRWCSEVVTTYDVRTAFTGADVVLMMAKMDRKSDDDRQQYLKNVVSISRLHAAAINKFANKTVKVRAYSV